MKSRIKHVLTGFLVLLFSMAVAFAQQDTPAPGSPAFTQQEIDQMMAPIALYPDPLLSQILMAATYPLEVVEAAHWSRANPGLNGEQAIRAVEQNDWDASVKSLVAFPQVLAMMDEKLDWTERLGEAFLGQRSQVMDTVQSLRQKALATGNLRSNGQVRVEQQEQAIVVEPANPQVVYVPYYDPAVVYGPWWSPAYPPVYWSPWPDYIGIVVGTEFFFGAFDWRHRHVNVINVNNRYFRHDVNAPNHASHDWRHDSGHRHGVPYRDMALRRQFGYPSASPDTRRNFRGHDQPSPGERDRFGGRPEERGGPQPTAAGIPGRANSIRVPDVRGAPGISRPPVAPGAPNLGGAPGAPNLPNAVVSPPAAEQRHPVFEGIGRGAEVRGFSERGHSSYQIITPGAAPGSTPAPASRRPAEVSVPQPSGRFPEPRFSEPRSPEQRSSEPRSSGHGRDEGRRNR